MLSPERIAKGLYWDRAWSLVEGCTPTDKECEHCWAAQQAHMRARQRNPKIQSRYAGLTERRADGVIRFASRVRVREDLLELPLRVKRPQVWSVWTDLFHLQVTEQFIRGALDVMEMADWHRFLVCTKRPYRVHKLLGSETLPPNVAIGTTCGHRGSLYRLSHLLRVRAACRFVSIEPLVEDLVGPTPGESEWFLLACLSGPHADTIHAPYLPTGLPWPQDSQPWYEGLDWGVVGCESGLGRRPCDTVWVERIGRVFDRAGRPLFVKQLSSIGGKVVTDLGQFPPDLRRRELPAKWLEGYAAGIRD